MHLKQGQPDATSALIEVGVHLYHKLVKSSHKTSTRYGIYMQYVSVLHKVTCESNR